MDETTLSPQEQFRSLMQRIERMGMGRETLNNVELSLSQLGLLLSVRRSPGIRVNELAQQVGLSAPTVSVSLRKLEQDGWVQREADPQDKRSYHLYLTRKATEFAKRAEAFQRKKITDFLNGLNPQEQSQLVRLLDKAISSMEEQQK
ncbi:MAG: MarR family transcriptional regulator [Anaerolineales bacterium]|nr:MAG: MarR family transcriptional regulator [Anaerolineales bacterium]